MLKACSAGLGESQNNCYDYIYDFKHILDIKLEVKKELMNSNQYFFLFFYPGLSPHTAMQIAEKLYTQGYVSYPRTETSAYPENYDLRSAVRTLANVPDYKDLSHKVLGNFYAPKSGTDKGDHPPLTPTAAASKLIFMKSIAMENLIKPFIFYYRSRQFRLRQLESL